MLTQVKLKKFRSLRLRVYCSGNVGNSFHNGDCRSRMLRAHASRSKGLNVIFLKIVKKSKSFGALFQKKKIWPKIILLLKNLLMAQKHLIIQTHFLSQIFFIDQKCFMTQNVFRIQKKVRDYLIIPPFKTGEKVMRKKIEQEKFLNGPLNLTPKIYNKKVHKTAFVYKYVFNLGT